MFLKSLLATVLVVAPLCAQAPERTVPERVQRILLDVVNDPALAAEVAGLELAALGNDALPPMFEALCASADGEDRTQCALLYAFEHFPSARLTAFLESQATAEASASVRVGALSILVKTASAREFGLILRLAGDVTADPALARALEDALDALLARDNTAYSAIERAYGASPVALRRVFVRAVSRAQTAEGLRLLSRVLFKDEELRPLLLVTIGRMSNRLPRPVGEDVLSNVRRFVIEADPVALPEAILAVGYLDDCESIPQLIALLKNARRGLRANALWSLKRITGLGIEETPERWENWYQSEREWRQNHWASTLAALHGPRPEKAKVALMDLATRHLYRDAIAREVAELLTHGDADVVTLACATLGQIESPAALEELIGCLDHDDAIVRMAAWNALRAITKKELPLDAAAWSTARPRS